MVEVAEGRRTRLAAEADAARARRALSASVIGASACGDDAARVPAGREFEHHTARHAEDRFAAFMDNLPGMAFMKEAGGRYIYANEIFERVAGLPRGGARGRTDDDIWPDELAEGLRTGDWLVATRRSPIETLEEFPHAGGVRKWLLTKFPVSGRDASPPVVAGVAIDVTARRRSEDKVRQERDRAQTYLDVAGVAIVAFDPQGTVTLINRKGCELLECKELNILGRNWFTSFVPERARSPARRGFRRFARAGNSRPPRRRASGGGPRSGRSRHQPEAHDSFESLVLTAGGHERIVAWHASTMGSPSGEVVGVLASGEDVTERRRAEQALREGEQRYRLLAENATDMIWTCDLGGRILYSSPSVARTLGYPAQEIVGMSYRNIIRPSSRDVVAEALSRELGKERSDAGGGFRSWTLELEMLRRDGSTVPTETTMGFLREDDGAIAGVLAVTRDVTRRKALEEELQRSQRLEAIGRLAGGVAHDFNNLLTAIIGHGELLLGRLEDDGAREQALQIRNAGEMAAALTRRLLAFGRGQPVRTRAVDVNSVIEKLDRLLACVVGDDIILDVRLAPDLGSALTGPAMLEQAVMNMIVNSSDAMPDGGRITIETRNVDVNGDDARPVGVEPGRYVELRVSDTGRGMDEQTMSRVFEPFFTTKERGRGTGLGLATVYGVVRNSGGHIWVESEESKGTTFTIYLKRVDGPPEEAPAPVRGDRAEASAGGSETVLIAEDDDVVRDLARAVLSDCGYRVLEASDGRKAMQASRSHAGPVHILLADVVMPGMGGRELFERLARERPGLRAVFVSGYAEDAIARDGGLPPGTAFQEKPFGPEALTRMVRAVLDAPAVGGPGSSTVPVPPGQEGADVASGDGANGDA
ncbi:MAG: PAS domain S-box protein [Planctomycetota bacterium]|jgi:PAS domain S-box-containing protein